MVWVKIEERAKEIKLWIHTKKKERNNYLMMYVFFDTFGWNPSR